MTNPLHLGVNIDHIATVRQARGTAYPDPVAAAFLAEQGGADAITIHLREDRRHIQERDLELLSQTVTTRINLECAVTSDMLAIAQAAQPEDVCLVPERREEVTTEGGLNVAGQIREVTAACRQLADRGIRVSLFVDPDIAQLEAAVECGAPVVELHTGCYANARGSRRVAELERIRNACHAGESLGLIMNAGHGLHYHNTQEIAAISVIRELNIGHAIIARALFVGLERAVSEMKNLMNQARSAARQ